MSLNPQISGVTLTQGFYTEIEYKFKPVLAEKDQYGVEGLTRFVIPKIINSQIKVERGFVFSIIDVSESEKTSLLALNGSNNIEFTIDGVKYFCTCSCFPFQADEQGQIIDSIEMTMKVRSFYSFEHLRITGYRYPIHPKNPDAEGECLRITEEKV